MAAAIPALTTAAPFITAGTSVLAAAQAGARGPPRESAPERRGSRSGDHPRPRPQQPADAARPHHRR